MSHCQDAQRVLIINSNQIFKKRINWQIWAEQNFDSVTSIKQTKEVKQWCSCSSHTYIEGVGGGHHRDDRRTHRKLPTLCKQTDQLLPVGSAQVKFKPRLLKVYYSSASSLSMG